MKRTVFFLILAVLGGIYLIRWFTGADGSREKTVIDGQIYEVVKREVDTIVVTHTEIVTKRGQDIFHDRPVYVTVTEPVDTLAILARYNSLQPVIDTLTLDHGFGTVIVKDTLYRNQLRSRVYESNLKQTTISEKVFLKVPDRFHVWAGGQFGTSGPAAVIGYQPKDSRLVYEAGMNVLSPGGFVGVRFRIR